MSTKMKRHLKLAAVSMAVALVVFFVPVFFAVAYNPGGYKGTIMVGTSAGLPKMIATSTPSATPLIIIPQAVGVPDNANDWTFMENDSSSYMDSIEIEVSGTQVAWYEPNTMLIGAVVPDRKDGDNAMTLTWGSNTALTIQYGEMTASEPTIPDIEEIGGFDMPLVDLPVNWFATGSNIPNLPFYDSFSEVALSTGQPVQTLYFLAIIGVAIGVFLILTIFARMALLGVIGFNLVLVVGASMTVVPLWIPFAVVIAQVAIMYLYKQTAY